MKTPLFLCLLLLVLAAAPAMAQTPIDIPDANFRWFLETTYFDSDLSTPITDAMAAGVTGEMSCGNRSIADLTGIKYFVNITTLYCSSNRLTQLDVSGLTNLQNLICSSNRLTQLDVSGLTSLQELYCSYNHLAFDALETLWNASYRTYSYCPQRAFGVARDTTVAFGTSYTLSITRIAGQGNRYQWIKDNASVSPLLTSPEFTLSNLTLQNSGSYTCRITNTLVTDCYLSSEPITVNVVDPTVWTALTDLYQAANGDQWTRRDNWLSTRPFSEWYGLTVSNGQITGVNLSNNNLSGSLALDFGGWPALQSLNLSYNRISGALRLAALPNLQTIELANNQLTQLTLPDSLPKLERLYCQNNQLTQLTLPDSLPKLEYFSCDNNKLTQFVLPEILPELYGFSCANNQVGQLTIRNAPKLNYLNCMNNKLTALTLDNAFMILVSSSSYDLCAIKGANNQLTQVNLSRVSQLRGLDLSNNRLTQLTLPDSLPELRLLNCANNQLTQLSLSNLPKLNELDCSNNKLTQLTMTNAFLVYSDYYYYYYYNNSNTRNVSHAINCANNQLTALTLVDLQQLAGVNTSNNPITQVAFSSLPMLASLDVSNCQLTQLSTLNLPNLATLNCSRNRLTELALSNMPSLFNLNCSYNQLTRLELDSVFVTPNSNYAQQLDCSNNQLSQLILADLPELDIINCSYNRITQLTLSNLPNLTGLNCSYNMLTRLEVPSLFKLNNLNCSHNQLTQLELPDSSSTAYPFPTVKCSYNQLSQLDLTNFIAMSELDCSHNKLTSIQLPQFFIIRLNCSHNFLKDIAFPQSWTFETFIQYVSAFDLTFNQFSFGFLESMIFGNIPLGQITYCPQSQLGEPQTRAVGLGDDALLTVNTGGRHNLYQWFKDGAAVTELNSRPELRLYSLRPQDAGTYTCRMINNLVTDCALLSAPIYLNKAARDTVNYIAYTDEAGQIHLSLHDLSGQARRDTVVSVSGLNSGPDWWVAPDKQTLRVAWTSRPGPQAAPDIFLRVSSDGGQTWAAPQPVANDPAAAEYDPGFSADGAEIIYSGNATPDGVFGLFRYSVADGRREREDLNGVFAGQDILYPHRIPPSDTERRLLVFHVPGENANWIYDQDSETLYPLYLPTDATTAALDNPPDIDKVTRSNAFVADVSSAAISYVDGSGTRRVAFADGLTLVETGGEPYYTYATLDDICPGAGGTQLQPRLSNGWLYYLDAATQTIQAVDLENLQCQTLTDETGVPIQDANFNGTPDQVTPDFVPGIPSAYYGSNSVLVTGVIVTLEAPTAGAQLIVSNKGGQDLIVSGVGVEPVVPWVDISPLTETRLAADQDTSLTISINMAGLAAGVYTAGIVVSSGETRQVLPLTVSVGVDALAGFHLFQNMPNPAEGSTEIQYLLFAPGPVELTVYNIAGQRVRRLVHAAEQNVGFHTAIWNGRNDDGQDVAGGLYFYSLKFKGKERVKKLTLLR